MARVSVATQQIVQAGLTPAMTAASALGHIIDDGDVILMVVNGGGAPINVTLDTTATQDGLAVADRVVAVAAGATKLIGPIGARTFEQADGAEGEGRVHLDYSAVTSVTHAVLAL